MNPETLVLLLLSGLILGAMIFSVLLLVLILTLLRRIYRVAERSVRETNNYQDAVRYFAKQFPPKYFVGFTINAWKVLRFLYAYVLPIIKQQSAKTYNKGARRARTKKT